MMQMGTDMRIPKGKLLRVPLAKLWEVERNREQLEAIWKRDEAKCREYAALPTPFPPIKVEELNFPWHISDGRHRVLAARVRGDLEIDAIVTEALFCPE
jgi:hypothetical protein